MSTHQRFAALFLMLVFSFVAPLKEVQAFWGFKIWPSRDHQTESAYIPPADSTAKQHAKKPASWMDLVVETGKGAVQGIGDKDALAWLGIPYAKPPVDQLRWKAPRDPDPWQGILPADRFCEPCSQFGGIMVTMNPEEFGEPIGSEDCLYLNVWRPDNRQDNLPVYFWIHGGGNSIGEAATDIYNGANMASREGMVVVSINYRLGPLGWFAHPALRRSGDPLDDSGNYGTLDIIKALEWVQKNIRAFGGNPENVTIAGESAGGINVYSLLTSPLARGLFHRGISESGFPLSVPVAAGDFRTSMVLVQLLLNDGLARTRREARAFLDTAGGNWIENYLRSKEPSEILACYLPPPSGMLIGFLLTHIFEDGVVIPANTYQCLQNGNYIRVPFLAGSNAEELKLFLPFLIGKKTEAELCEEIIAFDPDNPDQRLQDFLHPLYWPIYEPIALSGAMVFQAAGVDTPLTLMKRHQDDLYAYKFVWDDEPAPMNFLIGAGHALEIPFVFANFNSDALSVLRFAWSEENRPEREALSAAMMHYWTQFARTGDPNDAEYPLWPRWSTQPAAAKRIVFDAGEISVSSEIRQMADRLQEVEPMVLETLDGLSRPRDLLDMRLTSLLR